MAFFTNIFYILLVVRVALSPDAKTMTSASWDMVNEEDRPLCDRIGNGK